MSALRRIVSRCACLMASMVLTITAIGAVQDPVQEPGAEASAEGLVANKSARTYHLPGCELARRLAAKSKANLPDVAAAVQAGYKPCEVCNPGKDEDGVMEKGEGEPSKESRAGRGAAAKLRNRAGADGRVVFSREIAPILLNSCRDCHNDEQKRGEFNVSSFEKLLAGSKSGPVIVPGKPEESLLVELITERKMPRGNNNRLSDGAIEKITRWVREGALLDGGSSPTAALESIAPSSAELRRASLAQLDPDELDARLEATALARMKQAVPNLTVTTTKGPHFLLFSSLPEDRAKTLIRALESQRGLLGNLLGAELSGPLTGPEKVSVYVFLDANGYAEFVRGVEQRELELGIQGHARLGVDAPYLAAIDPLGGGEDLVAKNARSARRKGTSFEDSPPRALAAILAEALTSGVIEAGGKAPRWLSTGLGAYVATQVEPAGMYAGQLRNEAAQQFQLGWNTKATEALGDQGSPEAIRAIGFSLCECLARTARPQFAPFVRGIALEGGQKLDDAIRACFGPQATREAFLAQWGGFVANQYGAGRRR